MMDLAVQLSDITEKALYLQGLDVVDVKFKSGHSLEVFVASSPDQRIRGLSNLEHIPTDGMLFYYPSGTYKPFSVKEMAFDLDIGWYDAGGKLLDVRNCVAGDSRPVVTARKFNYVIETSSKVLPFSDLDLNNG